MFLCAEAWVSITIKIVNVHNESVSFVYPYFNPKRKTMPEVACHAQRIFKTQAVSSPTYHLVAKRALFPFIIPCGKIFFIFHLKDSGRDRINSILLFFAFLWLFVKVKKYSRGPLLSSSVCGRQHSLQVPGNWLRNPHNFRHTCQSGRYVRAIVVLP